MLLAGDEFGRTQGGNNNAYCQDDEIGWVHWDFDDRGRRLLDFTKTLIATRGRHRALRHRRFLGRMGPEQPKDLIWLTPGAQTMDESAWNDDGLKVFGMLIDVPPEDGQDRDTVLILCNGGHGTTPFVLPDSPGAVGWRRLIDTQFGDAEPVLLPPGASYDVRDRSLILFEASAEAPTPD
jgi:glycogen operon protein